MAKSEILQKEHAENAGGYSHNLLVLPSGDLTLLCNLPMKMLIFHSCVKLPEGIYVFFPVRVRIRGREVLEENIT